MLVRALERRLRATLPMARLSITPLPGLAPLRLALISDDFPGGPLPRDVMRCVIERPAYWAFCWGSGLALGRFLLDHPEWVRGRRVVDLGAGSGVAAIAAAYAGAAHVTACDIDPDARAATQVNAALNHVALEVQERLPAHAELLLMADVLYDRSNLPLLLRAQTHADAVLVADTRIRSLPQPGYRPIARIDACTLPNLGEFDEFNTAHVFAWQGPSSA